MEITPSNPVYKSVIGLYFGTRHGARISLLQCRICSPKKAVASMVGIGGMAGGLGGVAISKIGGALFDHNKALGYIQTGYTIMFSFCAVAYLIAWAVIRQPAFKMGELATELLLQLIESKRPVTEFETRVLTTELLVRGSTKRMKGKLKMRA